jgi:hypothetical protein
MRLVCLWCVLWCWLQAGAADVYRCDGPDGRATFQQHPCTGAGRRVEVPAPNVVGAFVPSVDLARDAQVRSAVERGQVLAGMTEDEVRRALGVPQSVLRSAGVSSSRAQLAYRYRDGTVRYVHLADDAVRSVSEHTRPARRPLEPCYTALEIRNAGVGAQSSVLPPEERQRRLQAADAMARCLR